MTKRDSDMDDQLNDLDNRLSKAKHIQAEKQPKAPNKDAGMAYRMAMEMVVAIALSAYVGHLLDGYFETKPWLMLVMILLGMAAGFKNILRVANKMTTTSGQQDAKTEQDS